METIGHDSRTVGGRLCSMGMSVHRIWTVGSNHCSMAYRVSSLSSTVAGWGYTEAWVGVAA